MADLYQNFKSQTEINAVREQNKKARQIILENAKQKFKINEAKKEKARRQGEGSWMLDSVSNRISREEKDFIKAKEKSKKKKKKKRKKKKRSSSSSSSGSDSEEKEEKWVESNASAIAASAALVKGPQLQRESWMEAPLDLIPTTSRQEIREAINKNKEEAAREAERAQQPGQHARELNPYWRDGGTGLPEAKAKPAGKSESPSAGAAAVPVSSAGDGGYSWLHKAYTRCVQQAEDEGRSLQEVAAERYGSLRKLEKMMAEAKQKMTSGDLARERFRDNQRQHSRDRSRSREKERERNGSREGRRERSRSIDRKRERSRSRERRKDTSGNRERHRRRSRSDERRSDRRERSNSLGRGREGDSDRGSRFKHPDLEEERSHKTGSSRHSFRRPSEEEDRGSARKHSMFMRPSESDARLGERGKSNSRSFMKPEDAREGGHDKTSVERKRCSQTPDKAVPRWKKRTERETEKNKVGKLKEEMHGKKSQDYQTQRERKRKSSSPSSSDDSEDSKSCDSGDAENSEDEDVHNGLSEPPPKILSEEELNDLAAKILRAEIMGDDDMAAELKSKLEAARQLRQSLKSEGAVGGKDKQDFSHRRRLDGGGDRLKRKGKDEEEDNVVVLSRTNKGGMVRPVLGSASEQWGGKSGKKKKKAAETHDVSGERTIYFDDDTKFDLKSLVEQEKAGTAEDQNAMFARLAGRSGDRDLDVDDMFVSKAARKQNEEGVINKDRSAAIFEHRKINAAMEKCNRCFDKVPKHLIIAIGAKSYLSLPPHRSLTEGHCLIVPMQHVASCVAMDEDVWREMQLFRKTLVQMFLEKEEDVVFMETVMHLKHFPHTAIECIPLEKETGDLSPIYFKKAIQEVGPEWADNKKLHSLREKDVRHVIPKGFPYFSVDFGLQGGYATVIEDEQTFPAYFGREIVGGMIDAEPALWRKPHKQSFEDQRQKVLKFEEMWRPHDWTQNLGSGD